MTSKTAVYSSLQTPKLREPEEEKDLADTMELADTRAGGDSSRKGRGDTYACMPE